MKKYKKDRNLAITYSLIVLVVYFSKNFGESIAVNQLPRVVQWLDKILVETQVVPDLGLLLGALLLFVLIGAIIAGIATPFLDFERLKLSTGRKIVFTIILLLLALSIFIPLHFNKFDLAYYDRAIDMVAALGLCLAIWVNHKNYVKMKTDWDHRKSAAIGWTSMSVISVLGLMGIFRIKKK